MKDKTRFIQLEFFTIYDKPSDYIVIVEVIDDVPCGSFCVPMPKPFTLLPRYPFIKN